LAESIAQYLKFFSPESGEKTLFYRKRRELKEKAPHKGAEAQGKILKSPPDNDKFSLMWHVREGVI